MFILVLIRGLIEIAVITLVVVCIYKAVTGREPKR